MEYIYGLSDNKKAVIFNEGNNIFLGIMSINKMTQWSVIAKDYRLGLNSCIFQDSIYVVYVTTSNELVWQKVGGDNRLVIFSKVGESIDIYNIKIIIINEEIYLMYQSKNLVTGAFEIRYILPKAEENGKVVISVEERIEDYDVFRINYEWFIFYKTKGENTPKIFIMNMEEMGGINNMEEYILCKLNSVTELEEKCKTNEHHFNNTIKKMENDFEKRLKKTVEFLENEYKKQYDELSEMTKEIQDEGKKWRELYYKSVKKK